ncbi:hypothetical protein CSC70_03915 [Pseudoxanthomonas kalamensis DSM 18571]|uniref:hypothetical protein n=1 Tax=Pseudoxanthomonas kalamensis TaxID=289483 RepID=UPI001B865B80|nr:hypothetical protein [Pseudoxanthomonas kalamensis]KAF1711082.1 hypothetical protein CSC70_03915 [Pseudoxanthomonas kalamensis DSM 18571]
MKMALIALLSLVAASALAADGYKVAGRQGAMVFVSVDKSQKDNEDVYRIAVAESCAGRAICNVHFWVGQAASRLPMTDAQVNSKVVTWQQNLNTGLRRWVVNCKTTDVFKGDRECG